MFNYSTAKHIITTDLCIIPGENAIIKDITNEYKTFRKMYKYYLKDLYDLSVNEEVYKKIFMDLLKEFNTNKNFINIEDIISDSLYLYGNIPEEIAFEYEDTLFVNLRPLLEEIVLVKYKEYYFVDFIVYEQYLKVLCTKEEE